MVTRQFMDGYRRAMRKAESVRDDKWSGHPCEGEYGCLYVLQDEWEKEINTFKM